jgi:hypothetical protein
LSNLFPSSFSLGNIYALNRLFNAWYKFGPSHNLFDRTNNI